jgi:hypothetical protein
MSAFAQTLPHFKNLCQQLCIYVLDSSIYIKMLNEIQYQDFKRDVPILLQQYVPCTLEHQSNQCWYWTPYIRHQCTVLLVICLWCNLLRILCHQSCISQPTDWFLTQWFQFKPVPENFRTQKHVNMVIIYSLCILHHLIHVFLCGVHRWTLAQVFL